MKVIENEKVCPFDVDGTLILPATDNPKHRHIDIEDPVNPAVLISMRVHEPMVRLLQEELARRSHVIVWSRSGFQWAKNVLDALGFCYEDITVMSKPLVYFDDVNVDNWMKDRVFLDPDIKYK